MASQYPYSKAISQERQPQVLLNKAAETQGNASYRIPKASPGTLGAAIVDCRSADFMTCA